MVTSDFVTRKKIRGRISIKKYFVFFFVQLLSLFFKTFSFFVITMDCVSVLVNDLCLRGYVG